MNTWIIIPVLLLVFFVALTLLQRRYRGAGIVRAEKDKSFLREGTADFSPTEPDALTGDDLKEVWWKHVSSLHQLQLALHLAEKAMPVWEKFTSLQAVSYRAVPSGPLTTIESDLLQRTVEEICLQVQSHFPVSDLMKINQYHKRFIGPVLALKDGIWICSYPVKKIFLSVYFILMSIVEQHGTGTNGHFLSEAISALLECMELSKLYTPEEIASFLETYRCSL